MTSQSRNSIIRWLLIVVLTWGIPAAILCTGIKLFLDDRIVRSSAVVLDNIEQHLDNFVYDSSPARFFQPHFNALFRQLKGLSPNHDVLERIVEDFIRQWPEKMIEVYLFNGEGNVFPIEGARKEHEIFYKLVSSEYENGKISPGQLSLAGNLFPAPDLMLTRARDQRDRAIELGNPDRYSLCYFDCDRAIRSRFVAGILIFIHYNKMDIGKILDTTVNSVDPLHFGYITESETNHLPQILEGFDHDKLLDYEQQYPTSSFTLGGKLISLRRFNDTTLLVGAYEQPTQPWVLITVLLLTFAICSYFFIRLSYRIVVMQIRFQHNMRQRLIGLFALCYALPILGSGFLIFQYLRELKHSMIAGEKQSNYRRLADIDAGFTRFTTAKLLDFRRFTEQLKLAASDKEQLRSMLQAKYDRFEADSIHMLSSQSEVIYSNDLLTAEVRRHFNKPRQQRQKILDSWKFRQAAISERHIKALFSSGRSDGFAEEPEKTEGHAAFLKLFTSTALAAMDYYNQSHGTVAMLKRSSSSMVVDTIIESNTQSLFQSARTNIGKFTNIQGLSEIFLAYLDVLPGPTGESWYAFTMLVDLVNFQRQYLENLFGDLQVRSNILNRVFPEEDIRAVSTHQYAVNFPSVLEFKNFEAIIRRSDNDFKTFTQQMMIDGRESLVSVLRGSYLKHYLLIKVSPIDKLNEVYRKRLNIIIIIFAVILTMGLALARLLTRLLILPISDIMQGVKALAKRNYQHRIPVRSENEFGILAKAFNESAEILKKLTISEKIRKQLYPEPEFRCGSYLITTANSNSRIILSDFFDYFPLKQGAYAVVLAEVSGNDISAAYLTAMLKTTFTLLSPSFPFAPDTILTKLNDIFMPYYQKGHMTTCLIGMIDPTNDKMLCSNAGQSYPISVSMQSEEKSFISLPSAPLGIDANSKFKKHIINLDKRTTILYSDGAINLLDQAGEKLGQERFLEIVYESLKVDPRNPAEEILRRLDAVSMSVPWRDDITIMCIQNRI
ncbi:MAG: SpoIIE family protein phosphatase [Candidatus Riflebacteria bacterium]|nr:SpoIIE family protein phosphatase [Candidatus Riflebacteria bacterium]